MPATSHQSKVTRTATTSRPERAALVGLIVNTMLASGKMLAGLLGHSFALVADAVESLVDIVGSAVIWGGLRYGAKAPDKEHPLGHGKAEALAAVAVGFLVLVAGIGIAVQAVREVVQPQPVPAPFTLGVLILVLVIKETLYRFTRRSAEEADSSAGYVDAWHHRSDAITSAFALVGIAAGLIGGTKWAAADDWAALAASFVIVFNGVRLLREPFSELMDANALRVANDARVVALGVPGILGIERCEAQKSGRSYRVVMHAEVDPAMSVQDSHALTRQIKLAVRRAMPGVVYVLVHIEPHPHRLPIQGE